MSDIRSPYQFLNNPTEIKWLTEVEPADVKANAHRIYEYMAESGLPADSFTRELAFEKAAEALGIDYEVLYLAWINKIPVQ